MTAHGIGARVIRKEDDRHLHGRGRFVSDIAMPGLQDVAFCRSSFAHGRITDISKPAGRENKVFTAADLKGVLPIIADSGIPGFKVSEFPALATGKVRYVGECVAMCVAPSRAEAEDLADLVKIAIDPLPVVIDTHKARQSDSALVHDDWDDNLFLTTSIDGDIDTLAKTAPIKVTREFKTARQCMHPMEGKGVLAYWDFQADQLIVHTSTQVPHMIRTALSEFLGLDQSKVRVVPPDVGGGFGYKCVLQPEEVCIAWLAKTYQKPFRWIEDRREHLTAGANSREHHYQITAYADERGRLLGLDAEIAVSVGAYSVWPFTACIEAAQAGGNLPGPYDFRIYRCKTYSVATNKPPFTPYRGVARPGVCFAIELMMDAIAREVGRDPLDVRAENLVKGSQMPYNNVTGKHYDSGDYPKSLSKAAEMIGARDVRERQKSADASGRRIGLGFSTFTEQSAHGTKVFASWGLPLVPGFEQATVRLTPDGRLEIRAGIHTIGQGLETTLSQVAVEELGIAYEHVRVTLGDTASTPYSTGAYASRGMVMAGGAVSNASRELAKRIRKIAAHLMQCSEADVRLENGLISAGAASISFADIGKAWYLRPEQLPDDVNTMGLEVTEGYKPDVDSGVFTYSTHAAVVAVDTETGMVEILDYVIVDDCGRMVNPMIVDGQLIGGAAQGIGTALFEETPYDAEGQPLSSTLQDYTLPGAAEVPHMQVEHFETPSPYSRYGMKGVGEGGAIAPPGAIVNAINDALQDMGVELTEIPATPHRILTAIINAEDNKAAMTEPTT